VPRQCFRRRTIVSLSTFSGEALDDEVLVARVRAGDFDAASALLSRYQDVAYTAALRLLGEPADAEDVAQDALVRAYTRLSELHEHASFSAWLRRIAVNLSLNALRRRGQLHFESLDAEPNREGEALPDVLGKRQATPEDEVLKNALRDEVEAVIQRLPPEQRVAVVLRDMYGYDVAEIAELQRCGLSAAKMRIRRGRARLRCLLTESSIIGDLRGG
jgi:RNA polymerase sigma-70 factor, ECF subfamily